jgi:serine O-acetyltransferase
VIQNRVVIVKSIARVIFVVLEKIIEILTGICILPQCRIGGGLYVGHFGPTIVHPQAIVGENCNLSQGVTIGVVQSGDRKGVPRIGDRVYIGPNAVVIGNIDVGDDAAIGAGAVVIHSVPPRAVVVGNPARTVSFNGSFELVRFENMEEDPARMSSLQQQNEGTGAKSQ